MPVPCRHLLILSTLTLMSLPAAAQDDARTRQLRLLCAQLSGDLTDPGGIAAFRRCLTARDPLGEIGRDNHIGGAPAATPDRPDAASPAGFGRNSRQSVAEGLDQFQTIDGKHFFGIDKDAQLWRWTMGAKDARVVDQKIASFRMVDAATLLVKDIAGTLWRETDGAPRTLVGQAVADFQPLTTTLYVLGTGGILWRQAGDAATRAEIDRTVAAFQAVDTSVVFVLGTDHKLWRETGDMHTRELVASNIAAFEYVPDGNTSYVLTMDGALWRQEGAGKPEAVDTAVASFQAVDMHLAYVLGKDGRLWRELGARDHAVLVDHDLLVKSAHTPFQATDQQHIYLLTADRKLWAETMPPGR